jgi:glycosyltransferase involved in cell wall biosynthesis
MNPLPLVSVITVSLNCKEAMEGTIKSVLAQTYSAKEYIIVDGGSTDGTVKVIEQHKDRLTRWVTEPDRGVYDAMNKAISLASGEWLIFMNAGDLFFDEGALERTIRQATENVDILYSDTWLHGARSRLFVCDHRRKRIIHQSFLYRKRLHEEVGTYLVAPGVTISDYLFFNLVAHKRWKKVDRPIAICDDSGISSHSRTLYQKLAVDLVFGSRGRLQVSMLLALYPFYKILKRFGLKVVGSGTGKNKIVG